jgi:tRNA 2-thiouridine synthesizing protein A
MFIEYNAAFRHGGALLYSSPLIPGLLSSALMADFDHDLDVRGLNCPLPILRTKKALAGMASGQVLRVQATDPGSVKDFQAFAKQTGNELLSHAEADKVFVFFMRKK